MLKDNEAVIEAILFASGEPVKYDKIAQVLDMPEDEIIGTVKALSEKYEDRGIRLLVYDDSCQLCSKEVYETYVKRAMGIRAGMLSGSTMEVLAIVAYNQPSTRALIEQIRGVDSSYAISTLLEKKLIYVSGRLDVPGKPNLYSTTDTFLRVFGFSSISELPKREFIESAVQDDSDEMPDVPAEARESVDMPLFESSEAEEPLDPSAADSKTCADSVPESNAGNEAAHALSEAES